MKIWVTVHTKAKDSRVIKSDTGLSVYVTKPPVDGKANVAVLKILSEYFKVSKSRIKLIRGVKSKRKLFDIDVDDEKN